MKSETVTVKNPKDGLEKSGVIMVPENLEELLTIVGPESVYRPALREYLMKAKRRILSGGVVRRRLLKLDINKLTEDQLAALRAVDLF